MGGALPTDRSMVGSDLGDLRYMVSYADSIHHPHEDLILRKLMAKKEQARAAVEPLLEEHAQLADLSRNLRDILYAATAISQRRKTKNVQCTSHDLDQYGLIVAP